MPLSLLLAGLGLITAFATVEKMEGADFSDIELNDEIIEMKKVA